MAGIVLRLLILSACLCAASLYAGGVQIRAYNIDYNWDSPDKYINSFAAPGRWADANPKELMRWYEGMGCNAVHSFGVSCNGYAWYKGGKVVPPQPGLKYDLLTEMVKIGKEKNIKVFAYFCVGANTKWGLEHPELSYGTPSSPHIPFTLEYIKYLCASIKETIEIAKPHGIMLDWIWTPAGNSLNGAPKPLKWLECEREMYFELTGKRFPGKENITKSEEAEFRRLSIARLWKAVYKTVKRADSDCLIWITNENVNSPDVAGSKMFAQADWLMNEHGDIEKTRAMRAMVKPGARLITCLAAWNGSDPFSTAADALKNGVGLYGFAKPSDGFLMKPVSYYLGSDISALKGDELNIAVLARVFNGKVLNH